METINNDPSLPRLDKWMNAEIIKKEKGTCLVRMAVLPHPTHGEDNPRVAGGVIMSLLDYSIHHALDTLLTPGELHATIEMKINFIRPGSTGNLLVEAHIINKGKRVAVAEASVIQEETQKVVAKALSTETYISIPAD